MARASLGLHPISFSQPETISKARPSLNLNPGLPRGPGHSILETFDSDGQIVNTLYQNDGSNSWQPTITEAAVFVVLIRENGDNQTATFRLMEDAE